MARKLPELDVIVSDEPQRELKLVSVQWGVVRELVPRVATEKILRGALVRERGFFRGSA